MINEDVRHIIEAELTEGEELLWADKPSAFPINIFDVCAVIFFLWFAIVMYNINYTSFSANKYFTVIMGVMPFYLGLVALTPILRAFLRSREVYAITSKRVLLQSYVLKRSFKSIDGFKDINTLNFFAEGTLTFIPHGHLKWHALSDTMVLLGFGFGSRMPEKKDKFHKIQNLEFVENLIRKNFLQPVKNPDPSFKTSRRARRRRRSI